MDNSALLTQISDGYAVIANTDNTEGRGLYNVILQVCEWERIAHRLAQGKGIMGAPALVRRVPLYRYSEEKHCDLVYGPIRLVQPTKEEVLLEKTARRTEYLIETSKKRPLTAEEADEVRELMKSGKS